MTWRLTLAASAALLACTAAPTTTERYELEPVPRVEVELEGVQSQPDRPGPSTTPTARALQSKPRVTRQQRREQLDLKSRTMPGWALHESAHYFILTCVQDAGFIEELKERSESMRRAIQRNFPHPDLDPVPIHTAPNVIRMLEDDDQFHSYGGPGGSSGFWSSLLGEIVLYDDLKGGGRRNTWATLSGMVFLEYLSSISGDAKAAPWFLYGHSDYYSGFKFVDGKHQPAPFDWRMGLAREIVETSKIAPLKEFVRFTHAQYQSANPPSMGAGSCYAQGWSFIWFLRGGQTSKLWNPAWDNILGTWWSVWRETGDANAATDRAFAGVNWAELQAAWEAFTREL
jgi:hypothetical protein